MKRVTFFGDCRVDVLQARLAMGRTARVLESIGSKTPLSTYSISYLQAKQTFDKGPRPQKTKIVIYIFTCYNLTNMSEESFNQPNFLDPEKVRIGKIPDNGSTKESYRSGSSVVVGTVQMVDPGESVRSARESVLKKYQPEEYDKNWDDKFLGYSNIEIKGISKKDEIFIFEEASQLATYLKRSPTAQELSDDILKISGRRFGEKIVAQVLEKYSLNTKAKKLKERHEKAVAYFLNKLPEIIVPTEFIIGTENNDLETERDGRKYIYELQERIGGIGLESVSEAIEDALMSYLQYTNKSESAQQDFFDRYEPLPKYVENFAKLWALEIKSAYPAQAGMLKKQLIAFVEIARRIPVKTDEIPLDLVWLLNMRFTSEGLRIIDTNISFPQNELANPLGAMSRYHRCLDIWQVVADSLPGDPEEKKRRRFAFWR